MGGSLQRFRSRKQTHRAVADFPFVWHITAVFGIKGFFVSIFIS
jgi:hypothetical protein